MPISARILAVTPNGQLAYSPEDWFAKITTKIDLLRSVEESYTKDIQKEIAVDMVGGFKPEVQQRYDTIVAAA